MDMNYVAYGLRLESSFELPGAETMLDQFGGLPSLNISIQSPSELEHDWNRLSGPPQWWGRLGDGCDLVIEDGAAGDLLFTYSHPTEGGDRARFRLHSDMRRLDIAPREPGLNWQRALIGKVLPTIAVMRGYEALHAAALESPEGVVAIMAPSGTGKSTLAIELLGRGWPLFADDVLVLDQAEGTIGAHPGTPHMSLAEALPDAGSLEPLGETIGTLAGERWFAAQATTKKPRPVRMLCLLERRQDLRLKAQTLTANPLLLAPFMLGLSMDIERQRRRFELYGDLTESATLIRLTASLKHRPAQLADTIEQALARHPNALAKAVG